MLRSLRQAELALLLTLLVMACLPTRVHAAGHPPGDDRLSARTSDREADPDDEVKHTRPPKGYEYAVQSGDTFWDIAAAHGLTVEALLAANNATGAELLQPGQKLFVPAEPAAVPHRTPVPAPAKPAKEPSRPAPQPTATTRTAPPPPPPPGPTAAPAAARPQPTVPPPVPAAEPTPATAVPAGPPKAAAPAGAIPEHPDWAEALLKLINAKRLPAGLPELAWSPELAAAAQEHAGDCARRNWGSHVGSDGAALWSRLARAGYPAAAASENWANAQSAQAAFGMWWNEPPAAGPHRRNILDPRWRELGIGIARGAWGWYVVTDFGAR